MEIKVKVSGCYFEIEKEYENKKVKVNGTSLDLGPYFDIEKENGNKSESEWNLS